MIVQCSFCGAPIEVVRGDRTAKCAYCGRSERVKQLETLHPQTPAGWAPPQQWLPPAGMQVQVQSSMPYHPPVRRTRSSGPVGVIIVLTALPGLIGGGIALVGSGAFSSLAGLDPSAAPTLGVLLVDVAPVHHTFNGTTSGSVERSGSFGKYERAPTIKLRVTKRSVVTLRTHSRDDTTLVVRLFNGTERYDDDGGHGHDSALSLGLDPGTYPVWVGHRGDGVPYELTVDAFAVNVLPGVDGLAFGGPALAANVTLGSGVEPMHWAVHVDATLETAHCGSHLAALPHLLVTTAAPRVATLRAHSEDDATLVVRFPTGEVLCDDDSGNGQDARLEVTFPAGVSAVWVGNRHDSEERSTPATLSLDPHAPDEAPLAPLIMPEAPAEQVVNLDALPGHRSRAEPIQGRIHGYLDAATLGNGCVGHVASAPTVTLRTSTPRHVIVRATGESDLVLASRGAHAEVVCNDDSGGSNPRLDLQLSPGETDVWVGPYQQTDASYTITVTVRP